MRFGIILLIACGSTPAHVDVDAESRAIAVMLDDWHDAASHADEDRYFGHFTEDGVFLGTDATERWGVTAFREYAHPHFEGGEAWTFRATRREVMLDAGGVLAWFDEELDTEGLGPARGSGVVRKLPDGRWGIEHYNLTITVPNERFGEVKALLEAEPASDGDPEAEADSDAVSAGAE